MRDILDRVFHDLDHRIDEENKLRTGSGARIISQSDIKVLGQTSLLAQPELTYQLELAQTGDLDAQIRSEHFVKVELKKILPKYHLIYDEDSELIFTPKGSQFNSLGEYKNLNVKVIDPESALVSKAVKAPKKNKQLIRLALAIGEYPMHAKRILIEGGSLDNFT